MIPREYAKMILFYTQELQLDAATPKSKDRLVMNAKLLRDVVEAQLTYWNYPSALLWKEIYAEHKDSLTAQVHEQKKKGAKRWTRNVKGAP